MSGPAPIEKNAVDAFAARNRFVAATAATAAFVVGQWIAALLLLIASVFLPRYCRRATRLLKCDGDPRLRRGLYRFQLGAGYFTILLYGSLTAFLATSLATNATNPYSAAAEELYREFTSATTFGFLDPRGSRQTWVTSGGILTAAALWVIGTAYTMLGFACTGAGVLTERIDPKAPAKEIVNAWTCTGWLLWGVIGAAAAGVGVLLDLDSGIVLAAQPVIGLVVMFGIGTAMRSRAKGGDPSAGASL